MNEPASKESGRLPSEGTPARSIRVDENGDWYYRGHLIFRPEILEVFYSKLDRAPSGEFFLADSNGPWPIDAEDTPFVISMVDFEREESGQESIIIRFKNVEKREVLDPGTLAIGVGNVLYCRVSGGRYPARFSRPAYYQLAQFITGDDSGQTFHIELNGEKHRIAEFEG